MRTRTSLTIGAVSLTAALSLAAGIAVGVSIPSAADAPTPRTVAEPRYVVPPVDMAQIMETCAWEQAAFYVTRSHEDAYRAGAENCARSLALIGADAITEKYAPKGK